MRLCLLNVRSINNKAMAVKDLVIDHDVDILVMTETWLRSLRAGNHVDLVIMMGTLCPNGYRFLHVPRPQGRGGGVGLLFEDSPEINSSVCDTFKTIELMDVRLRSLEYVRILFIYRPPDSVPCAPFYEEFSRLLERILGEHPGRLLIVGDLNFHLDDSSKSHATQFKDILEALNLKRLVKGATHVSGYTLDLLITSDESG